MKRWLLRILALLIGLSLLAALAALALVRRQGATAGELAELGVAGVTEDDRGIPLIEGKSWPDVIEAQGYVTASRRLFHMDLIRRSASGRLAEWFGPRLVDIVDRKRRLERWEATAERALGQLPAGERELLERYAAGVNRFIADHRWRWGLEYLALDAEPEPWKPRDSLLVILSMSEQLAESAPKEALASRWRKSLPAEWADFLFTGDHPWNEPVFGEAPAKGPALPRGAPLPKAPLDARELAAAPSSISTSGELDAAGSNSWAYCGKKGCFLANDPHLGATVPHLWFAVRLWVAKDDWVTGLSIPGLPGVVLGMNPHLAWAFTNVHEDVDDYLGETLSADGAQYLAAIEDGREVYRPLSVERSTIRVKGADPIEVVSRATHRGPLDARPHLQGLWSRQWLPLKDGVLRLASGMFRARSIEEMNVALDAFGVPAQNVVVVDRAGNIAYRATGTGIRRRVAGDVPRPALEGEWLGFEPPETRPRLMLPAGGGALRFFATANERIWLDPLGGAFTDDDRKDRIPHAPTRKG